MISIFPIGVGAGLVSSLLFGVVASLSPIGMLLSYIAPLPIFIASLGWHHRSGLIASAVGAILCTSTLRFSAGIGFAIGIALPAWWLAYLSLLGRANDAGQMEWYPLGQLLIWMAITAAIITLLGAVSLGPSYAEYHQTLETLIRALSRAELTPALLDEADVEHFTSAVAFTVPAIAAATFVFMLAINLWLASFSVRVSGRMIRPWPSLPDILMPRISLLIVGIGASGSFLLPGYLGLMATAISGAMISVLTFQGLAVVHSITRGHRARSLLLGLLYAFLLILSMWVIPLLAGIGAIAIAWKANWKT